MAKLVAVKIVPVTAAAVIPAELSRCTNVLLTALTSWVLNTMVGLAIVLKFIPALIVLNPAKALLKVSLLMITKATPAILICVTM